MDPEDFKREFVRLVGAGTFDEVSIITAEDVCDLYVEVRWGNNTFCSGVDLLDPTMTPERAALELLAWKDEGPSDDNPTWPLEKTHRAKPS